MYDWSFHSKYEERIQMKLTQWLLAFVMMTGIALVILLPFAVFLALQSSLLLGLWTVFSLAFLALILKYSVLLMTSGRMILLSCFGNIYNLFSPEIPGKNGTLDSGILLTIPFMVQRQRFSIGEFLVSLQSNSANTRDNKDDATAAVRVYAHIQVQLKQDHITLGRLVRLLTGADKHLDFTHEVEEDRYTAKDDSLLPSIKTEKCPCLARFLRILLQTPFDEAVGRAIPFFTLQQALNNDELIQERILEHLNEPGTVFREQRVREMFTIFDINLIVIAPTNLETAQAIAARNIAIRKGKATVATAEADGQATIIAATAKATGIRNVAASLTLPGGREALGAQTIENMENVQLITGMSPVEAGMSLLAANGGKPTPPKPPTTP